MYNILLLFYLPSFIGLVLVNIYIYKMFVLARKKQSVATAFVASIIFSMIGVLLSWFAVLAIAISTINGGTPILSWQVLLLPVFWGVLLIPINYMIRK